MAENTMCLVPMQVLEMTCAMKGKSAQRQPHSLVVTQLYQEAGHRSRRLELGLDAVDDRNIFSALQRR